MPFETPEELVGTEWKSPSAGRVWKLAHVSKKVGARVYFSAQWTGEGIPPTSAAAKSGEFYAENRTCGCYGIVGWHLCGMLLASATGTTKPKKAPSKEAALVTGCSHPDQSWFALDLVCRNCGDSIKTLNTAEALTAFREPDFSEYRKLVRGS